MTNWFKTINNVWCNKICAYIMNKGSDPQVLNHLLEFELKGKIPTSLIVEKPSKEFLSQMAIKGKHYFSLWELGWHYQNWSFLNWLIQQESFTLSESNLFKFLNHHLPEIKTLSPELEQFLEEFIKFYAKNFPQVQDPKDKIPTSIVYFMAPQLPNKLAKSLITKTAPHNFSDLRNLNEELWSEAWSIHRPLFPLLNSIEVFEKKKITFKYQPTEGFQQTFEQLNVIAKCSKLTVGLKNTLNLNSKQLIKQFEGSFLLRKKTVVELNLKFLNKALWVSNVFTPAANAFDFLFFLDYDLNCLTKTFQSPVSARSLALILNSFLDPQKKEILSNLKPSYPDLTSALDIFNRYSTYYTKLFKETEFKNLNRLEKIIDLIFENEEFASVPFQELNQEANFPAIAEVCNLTFPNNYILKVAKTNHELINWGIEMGHCIGGEDYQDDAANGECLLVALCLNNKPKYAVEIRDNRVIQIQGKSSSRPDNLLNVSLYKALEHFKLIRR